MDDPSDCIGTMQEFIGGGTTASLSMVSSHGLLGSQPSFP